MSLPASRLANQLATYKKQVAAKAKSAAAATAKRTTSVAVKMSSGTVTPSESMARGYLYSTRHPANFQGVSDALINSQTGAFRAKWFGWSVVDNFGLHVQIRNDDRKADWLQYGTSRMRKRPIALVIEREGVKILVQEIVRRMK